MHNPTAGCCNSLMSTNIKDLVNYLDSSSERERNYGLCSLGDTLKKSPNLSSSLIEDGVLHKAVKLLQSKSPKEASSAALLVGAFAQDATGARKVVEAGAIPGLLKLSSHRESYTSSDAKLSEWASTGVMGYSKLAFLANTEDPSVQDAILKSGVVNQVLSTVESPKESDTIKFNALLVIATLASGSDKIRAKLLDAKVLPPILSVLKSYKRTENDPALAAVYCLNGFASGEVKYKQELVDAGAVDGLAAVVSESQDNDWDVFEESSKTLLLLASGGPNFRQIVEATGAVPLLSAGSSPVQPKKKDLSTRDLEPPSNKGNSASSINEADAKAGYIPAEYNAAGHVIESENGDNTLWNDQKSGEKKDLEGPAVLNAYENGKPRFVDWEGGKADTKETPKGANVRTDIPGRFEDKAPQPVDKYSEEHKNDDKKNHGLRGKLFKRLEKDDKDLEHDVEEGYKKGDNSATDGKGGNVKSGNTSKALPSKDQPNSTTGAATATGAGVTGATGATFAQNERSAQLNETNPPGAAVNHSDTKAAVPNEPAAPTGNAHLNESTTGATATDNTEDQQPGFFARLLGYGKQDETTDGAASNEIDPATGVNKSRLPASTAETKKEATVAGAAAGLASAVGLQKLSSPSEGVKSNEPVATAKKDVPPVDGSDNYISTPYASESSDNRASSSFRTLDPAAAEPVATDTPGDRSSIILSGSKPAPVTFGGKDLKKHTGVVRTKKSTSSETSSSASSAKDALSRHSGVTGTTRQTRPTADTDVTNAGGTTTAGATGVGAGTSAAVLSSQNPTQPTAGAGVTTASGTTNTVGASGVNAGTTTAVPSSQNAPPTVGASTTTEPLAEPSEATVNKNANVPVSSTTGPQSTASKSPTAPATSGTAATGPAIIPKSNAVDSTTTPKETKPAPAKQATKTDQPTSKESAGKSASEGKKEEKKDSKKCFCCTIC